MIAVDSNIVLRFIAADDQAQYRQSYRLFRDESVYLTDTVLLECEWVLRFSYRQTPMQVASALRKMAGLENVTIESFDALVFALEWHEDGLDFADAFHLARTQRFKQLVTFDKAFVKRAAKIDTRCRVVELKE